MKRNIQAHVSRPLLLLITCIAVACLLPIHAHAKENKRFLKSSQEAIQKGQQYFLDGNYEAAIKAFDSAIAYNAFISDETINYQAFRGMAFSNLGLGRGEKALEWVNKLTNTNTDYDKALIHLVLGNEAEFLNLFGQGILGVGLLDKAEAGKNHVVVSKVTKGYPADKAGLQNGDKVTLLNGVPVEKTLDFVGRIKGMPPGSTIDLTLKRNGHQITKKITLGAAQDLFPLDPLISGIIRKNGGLKPFGTKKTDTVVANTSNDFELLQEKPSAGLKPNTVPVGRSGRIFEIEDLKVDPDSVMAGNSFETRITVFYEESEKTATSINADLHVSILQNKKVLKRFDTEPVTLKNGKAVTIIKKTKAARKKGTYQIEVEIDCAGTKVKKITRFDII